MIYRAVCERLEMMDRVTDAVDCFHQMTSELNLHDEHLEWILGEWSAHLGVGDIAYVTLSVSDFRNRSVKNLEHLGDTAVDARRYDTAISHYSTALSLGCPSPQSILLKRSKACVATGSWTQALDDANQVHLFYLRGQSC